MIDNFNLWCTKYILPIAYDESLSYYQQLIRISDKLNEVINSENTLTEQMKKLQDYINTNLEKYANDKLTEWLDDGTLSNMLKSYVDSLFQPYEEKIDKQVSDIQKTVTTPFNFKGDVDSISNLPSSGNKVNDTYYVKDVQYRMTWNGTEWFQSSLDESQYEDHLNLIDSNVEFYFNNHVEPDSIPFMENGRQLFNYQGNIIPGYYSNGSLVSRNDISGQFIKVKPNAKIGISYGVMFASTFDINHNFLGQYQSIQDGNYFTTESNAYWCFIALPNVNLTKSVISYFNDDGVSIGNYWDREFKTIGKYIDGVTSNDNYNLSFIDKGRVRCNDGNDSVCAYYAGIDCKQTINILQCRWTWENGTNSGTLALIINPNGVRKISDITSSSLHLQITNTKITLDVLGVKYGKYYYQRLIEQTLKTKMLLDNTTEYKCDMVASKNTVTISINNETYTGTFIPDDTVTSLSTFLGQYVTFEHFCNGNRRSYAMPQITRFIARNGNEYIVDEDFNKQDGVLQTTSTGLPYTLISTLHNRG